MEGRSTSYHAQALTRGIEILRELARSTRPVSLALLHERTELPRSTLIRLLSALEAERLVVRVGDDDGRWVLGHGVLELAAGYRESVDAETFARPRLVELAKRTNQTSNLGVLVGASVLHVCVAEPDRPMRFRSASGSLDETYCTGLGKMLLAQLAPAERAPHLPPEPFAAFTPRTHADRAELDADLATIAARGYSIDDGERDLGVRCLAVPLMESLTAIDVPIAVSVSGPTAELAAEREQEIVAELRRTAEEIRADENLVIALRITGGLPGGPVVRGA